MSKLVGYIYKPSRAHEKDDEPAGSVDDFPPGLSAEPLQHVLPHSAADFLVGLPASVLARL
jgi:hypothetical protein